MSKLSPNSPCPCGSKNKYKKCCAIYHKGALAPNALTLMKSRYSAFAAGESRYLIRTTHPQNSDYTEDTKSWRDSLDQYCMNEEFLGLKIIEFIDGESEAFVTFEAILGDGVLHEKSRFLKDEGKWLYVSGETDFRPLP